MTAKLYPYQKKGVKLIGQKYKGRVLLGDSMGLGKTIQSAQYLAENPEARPAVIVCPAMLKWNWQEELLRHYNIPSTILEGRKPPKQKNLLRNEKIVILNYEILQAWMPWIERMKPQIAIVDEIHYCKNRKTIRTKSVRRLSRICPQFIGLSGTPIENKPAEIWPIANMIRPDKFDSFWTFAQRYCEPQKMHGRWVFNGSSNRGELRDLLKATIMIRRTKEQVAEQLPPKTHVVVPLPIDKPEEYYAAKSDLIHWLKRNSVTKANSATHAKMLASVGYLKRLAARLKTKNAMAWFDDLLDSNPGKIILFAIHKKIVQRWRERYKDLCVVVTGETPQKERKLAVKAFQHDKRKQIFIGNIQAAGTGWNGQIASNVVFAELAWVPAQMAQATDRAHRHGQTNHVHAYYLIGKGTIEESICKKIQVKQQICDEVLDGIQGDSSLNLHNQLLEELRQEAKE